jgi:hypothetical protein
MKLNALALTLFFTGVVAKDANEDKPGVRGLTGNNNKCKNADGFSKFPYGGRDSSERLLLREGVINEIPTSLCGNDGAKNVILVIGDGMGWEMVSQHTVV